MVALVLCAIGLTGWVSLLLVRRKLGRAVKLRHRRPELFVLFLFAVMAAYVHTVAILYPRVATTYQISCAPVAPANIVTATTPPITSFRSHLGNVTVPQIRVEVTPPCYDEGEFFALQTLTSVGYGGPLNVRGVPSFYFFANQAMIAGSLLWALSMGFLTAILVTYLGLSSDNTDYVI